MKPVLSTRFAGTSEKRRAAFTLTELLVIIAMVAVLFSLTLSGLARAGGRSRVAQCGSNLKQCTMVFELYGMDNNNKLPPNMGGNWPWDIPTNAFNKFMKYGATRDMVYCPADPDQNNDVLWNYFNLHVIGYATTLSGIPGLNVTNFNSSLIPKAIPSGLIVMPPPPSSKRPLVADNIISASGQTNQAQTASYQWTGLVGGAVLPNGQPFRHRTSHLNGNLPAGGNIGMLDGHVEWRKFSDMISRMGTPPPAGELTWWW